MFWAKYSKRRWSLSNSENTSSVWFYTDGRLNIGKIVGENGWRSDSPDERFLKPLKKTWKVIWLASCQSHSKAANQTSSLQVEQVGMVQHFLLIASFFRSQPKPDLSSHLFLLEGWLLVGSYFNWLKSRKSQGSILKSSRLFDWLASQQFSSLAKLVSGYWEIMI